MSGKRPACGSGQHWDLRVGELVTIYIAGAQFEGFVLASTGGAVILDDRNTGCATRVSMSAVVAIQYLHRRSH